MKIIIESVRNGFIVKSEDNTYVFEIDPDMTDDKAAEHKALREMFYYIMEELGIFNSKHNKTRLNIEIEKQD